MDYMQSPLWFRIRKVLRYVRLYGVSRTLAKVHGQYHMRAHSAGGRPAPELTRGKGPGTGSGRRS